MFPKAQKKEKRWCYVWMLYDSSQLLTTVFCSATKVNTSRGGLIDNEALIEALRQGANPKKGWGVATFGTIFSYFKLLSCAILLDICQVISCGSWVQTFPLYWYDGSKIWLKDGRLWKMLAYQGIARSWNTDQNKKDRKQRTSSAYPIHILNPRTYHVIHVIHYSIHIRTNIYIYIQLQDDTCI